MESDVNEVETIIKNEISYIEILKTNIPIPEAENSKKNFIITKIELMKKDYNDIIFFDYNNPSSISLLLVGSKETVPQGKNDSSYKISEKFLVIEEFENYVRELIVDKSFTVDLANSKDIDLKDLEKKFEVEIVDNSGVLSITGNKDSVALALSSLKSSLGSQDGVDSITFLQGK